MGEVEEHQTLSQNVSLDQKMIEDVNREGVGYE
jgi:hypothetical protein